MNVSFSPLTEIYSAILYQNVFISYLLKMYIYVNYHQFTHCKRRICTNESNLFDNIRVNFVCSKCLSLLQFTPPCYWNLEIVIRSKSEIKCCKDDSFKSKTYMMSYLTWVSTWVSTGSLSLLVDVKIQFMSPEVKCNLGWAPYIVNGFNFKQVQEPCCCFKGHLRLTEIKVW